MSSDYQLEDTVYLPFTTRAFGTGIPTALVSGVIDIYEDVTATPIITAETLTVSLNGHAGFNMITVTATAATGFGAGQSYTAILDAGTVDSVSVIGEVVAHFTLDKSAAAKDLANVTDGLGALKTLVDTVNTDLSNGTDGLGALKALIDTVNTDLSNGTDGLGALKTLIDGLNDITAASVWAVDATGQQTQGTFGQAVGDPGATAKSLWQATVSDAAGVSVSADVIAVKAETALIVADTGELQTDWVDAGRLDAILDARASQTTADAIETDTQDIQGRLPAALASGNMKSDMLALSGDTTAADNLEESATTIIVGAAEAGTLSTTEMTSDLAEATDDHYIGRTVIWVTGVLAGQASDITDYLGSTGKLTYSTVTDAPSATDVFVIV